MSSWLPPHERYPVAAAAIAIGAAGFGYAASYLAPFVSGATIWAAVGNLAAGITCIVIGWRLEKPLLFWGGLATAVFGAYLQINAVTAARIAEAENDQRCLAIQRDMLSSMPLRSDGPDLFQALKCRPQGAGSVFAPFQGDDVDKAIEVGRRRANLPRR